MCKNTLKYYLLKRKFCTFVTNIKNIMEVSDNLDRAISLFDSLTDTERAIVMDGYNQVTGELNSKVAKNN
tara:strand:- start:30 stop:239 length:210 start_codon:yes stop_codon:yes gene_type:complete